MLYYMSFNCASPYLYPKLFLVFQVVGSFIDKVRILNVKKKLPENIVPS